MTDYEIYSFLSDIAVKTAKLMNAELGDGSSKRSSKGSEIFVTRIALDGSVDSDMVELKVKRRVKFLNDVTKGIRGDRRFRVLKKGRKPVAGAKYSWGGTLSLKDSSEADLYITVETR